VNKEQLIIEVTKCMRNTPYALRTYLQTYDNTVSKYVPLDLFPDQISLIEDYDNYNENIALKYRQAGVSTVTAAWASKKLAFAKKTKPEKILIIANKLDTSMEMANKVRGFVEQWPSWVGIGFSQEKNSQRHFKLNNNCEVKAVATSKDALRGYTPTILIFDEAAFIEADSDFWSACMASLSTGGKVIVVSTPNGYDAIYYEIYDQALRGMNDFKISEMYWHRDPRYTKDLYMVKTKDLVHYLLNREDYPKDVVVDLSMDNPYDRDHSIVTKYIEDGYKPCSAWFEGMVKKLKYDRRKVAQELECNFLGSGDNVFDSELMQNIAKNQLREPQAKLMGSGLWIFKEPVNGHKYVMGVDVSRGDSEDFSSIQIIDFDEREQVLEYVGKVPPDVLAEIAYKWGTMYNAYCVVDLTGGMGVATARKLQELSYQGGFYIDGVDTSNKWKYDPKINDKIPGINFNAKRVQIISALEEACRHGFRIYSNRTYNEMNTFVYINGRPDHQKGHHDDCIMGLSMAIYVAEKSFQSLEKVTNHTKAMINSWSTAVNENKNASEFFNPMVPQMGRDSAGHNRSSSKEDYQKYGWLFGAR
jgi:Terminase large subunit, T4likevirus-type, N-terminal